MGNKCDKIEVQSYTKCIKNIKKLYKKSGAVCYNCELLKYFDSSCVKTFMTQDILFYLLLSNIDEHDKCDILHNLIDRFDFDFYRKPHDKNIPIKNKNIFIASIDFITCARWYHILLNNEPKLLNVIHIDMKDAYTILDLTNTKKENEYDYLKKYFIDKGAKTSEEILFESYRVSSYF